MLRHYDDFELVIQLSGEHYLVQLLNSPAGQASGQFIPPFTQVELSNFYSRIGQMRRSTRRIDSPDLEAAKKFGDQLFRSVFTGELLGQLRTSMDRCHEHGRGLRIRLRLKGVPALAELPWEFLYDIEQDHFLATSTLTPMVRYLDLPQSVSALRVRLPLRILVVLSGPRNLHCLDAEGEWDRLKQSLAPLESNGSIILERLPAATLDTLRRRARGDSFHILHFIGHGGFDQVAGDGVLHFEDSKGMSDPIPGRLLGNVLRDHDCLRLAVLNACEGARQSNQDPFSGVAQSLCQQRLPAVVAMQFEISDDAAKTFAEEFYGAIADGLPVDAAVSESRKALFSGRFGQEWATPVLYMRSANGLLFDVQRRAKPAPETKPAPQSELQPFATQPVQPSAQPAPPAPQPPPPPIPQARTEEEAQRRLEAERLKQERALLDLEQGRLKAEHLKEEKRLKEERTRLEQLQAKQQAEQDRAKQEEAKRKAEQQRQEKERLRLEREQQAREREATLAQPPPPPPGASETKPLKPSHLGRNIAIGVISAIAVAIWIRSTHNPEAPAPATSTASTARVLSPAPTETAERHLRTGDEHFANGEYIKAISQYKLALNLNPDYVEAHSHLCNAIAVKGENASGQKGDYKAAISECEKAVQLAPDNAEAHNNLCNAIIDKESFTMELKGDYDRAIAECRRAIALNPNYAEAYNNLCNAIGTRDEQPIARPNDYNEAVTDCKEAIRLKPNYADPHKNLGDLFRDAGGTASSKSNSLLADRQFAMALDEYKSALAIKPNYEAAQAQLGYVLYQSRHTDEAITALNKAIELDPADWAPRFWLGSVLLVQKSDYDQAIQNFRKAIELKPDLADAEFGLSQALRHQGKSAEANEHLTRAYALDQNDKNIASDYKRFITEKKK